MAGLAKGHGIFNGRPHLGQWDLLCPCLPSVIPRAAWNLSELGIWAKITLGPAAQPAGQSLRTQRMVDLGTLFQKPEIEAFTSEIC